MEWRIDHIKEKMLAGKHMTMSLANNKTGELWRTFMQQRSQITNGVGALLYSMQVYQADYFRHFAADREFVKWAAIEVSDEAGLPEGITSITLPPGMYAVFQYKGPASAGAQAFQYIFGTWLPASEYELDDRPHFELLGDKYKNNEPDSEEEIWIPVKPK